jgi:exodeoxyribonuclease-3
MPTLKLYSWNVNGIRAVLRKGTLLSFIEAEQPDILCLQEVKAQEHEAALDLPEYSVCWNAASKKGYSGTAILSKRKPDTVSNCFTEDIQCKYLLNDAYGDAHSEGRILTAEYEHFYVVTVYTPNAKDDLSRVPLRRDGWDPAFLEYCRCLEKSKPVIFCGDLNVAHTELDLARPKPNIGKKGFTDEERAGFQAFVDAGFVDTFRLFQEGNGHYTWWSNFNGARERNIGWRIDYVLVSDALRSKVVQANIHCDVMGSDHCPVSITLAV